MSSPPAPTVSVVMTTFNGGRYIHEQLASLAAQTRRPDELVICDDGSTDATLEVAEEFRRDAPFPVWIQRNPIRHGYIENFLQGCSLASGSLIAFCDQDDVWQPRKLERCVAAFAADSGVVLAIHSADVVEGDLTPRGFSKPDFEVSGVLPRRGGDLDFSLPGFAMVVSADLVRKIDWRNRARDLLKSDRPLMAHDQWVVFLARSLGRVAQLTDRLALYRQHGANTCGAFQPGKPPAPTLERAANESAYCQRAEASAYYSNFLFNLTGSLPAAQRAALEASALEYRQQAVIYAARARLYEGDRSLGAGLQSYATLWQQRAYRPQQTGGLGWRAGVKDAGALLFG
jgi:glycosyltransferase involved in cell wall biosynthesis